MKKLSSLATLAAAVLLPLSAAAQEILDIHSHNVLPEYLAVLRAHGAELEEGFPLPVWTEEAHLAFMEENGMATAVLSMPAPQPYFGDSDECKKAVRQYNEACAALKAKHPGKFLFVAALPLPDVDAAIEEAAYALDVLLCGYKSNR